MLVQSFLAQVFLLLKHFLHIITVISLLPWKKAQQGSQAHDTVPHLQVLAVTDSPQPKRLWSCALDPDLPH